MQFHPVASIFPMMSVEEFKALKESIQARGQRNPIYVHEGKIVDGRNRYQACVELGIHPRYAAWDGVGLLVDFVWDMNASRRQLTGGALKISAGKYAREHVKEQTATLKVGSVRPFGLTENLNDLGRTREKTAKKFGLSETTV